MNKYVDPKFITGIVTIIAVALNNKFGWHLDPEKLVASVALSINFIVVQILVDVKTGKPSLNSTKFVTMIFACVVIGFSSYLDIDLEEESIWWIAGTAAAFITGKGVKDIVTQKNGGGANAKEYYSDTDHAV